MLSVNSAESIYAERNFESVSRESAWARITTGNSGARSLERFAVGDTKRDTSRGTDGYDLSSISRSDIPARRVTSVSSALSTAFLNRRYERARPIAGLAPDPNRVLAAASLKTARKNKRIRERTLGRVSVTRE